uniref:Uncharacterized protein n=1 Tax=Helianthus annuus TaxID=4232 RepID=A0A251T850_HELAN
MSFSWISSSSCNKFQIRSSSFRLPFNQRVIQTDLFMIYVLMRLFYVFTDRFVAILQDA